MRIAVVTTSYPGALGDPSGHFVRASCERLAREGHAVHVIAPIGSLFDVPRRSGDVWLHPAGGQALFRFPGALANAQKKPQRLIDTFPFALGVQQRLRALQREAEIDRVIAHWIVPSAWPLSLAVRSSSLFVHAHGADVRLLLRVPKALRESIVQSLLERGAHFYFAAQALKNALSQALSNELSARLLKVACVELPEIDMPDLEGIRIRGQALRASLGLRAGQKMAICIGRLIESKRVELALRSAAQSKAHLVVAGDGPMHGELAGLARALGCEVNFLGLLPRAEALAWLGAADVLLHPSAAEGAPTVVREARILKVPVIVCDVGDVRSWAASDPGIEVVAGSKFVARASTWLGQAVDASR